MRCCGGHGGGGLVGRGCGRCGGSAGCGGGWCSSAGYRRGRGCEAVVEDTVGGVYADGGVGVSRGGRY